MIPPIGSTPLPVAPAISIPTIAPVAPATPAQRPRSDTGSERRSEGQPQTYGRTGLKTGPSKGGLVDRNA